MESSTKSSKSHRGRDLLPSLKPSYRSLSLVFICVFLLLRNEITNGLLALEKQMQVLSTRDCCVETGSNKNVKEISIMPLLDSDHIFQERSRFLLQRSLIIPQV